MSLTTGQSASGEHILSLTEYFGSNLRYCSTVTALAATANVRPIRRVCCGDSLP